MVRLVVLLLLNIWALSATAEQQLDVYRVETIVANQSEAERVNAAKATFGDVILRLTGGDVAALQHPLIHQAINDAPNYLLRFNYTSERDTTFPNAVKPASGIKLILNYSPQAVEKLLRDAQLLQKPTQQKIIIQITNVQDFTAFKQAKAYLKTVAMIRHSELLSTSKDILVFNVIIDGDITLLKSTLELNAKWQLLESTTDTSIQPLQLNFRWQ